MVRGKSIMTERLYQKDVYIKEWDTEIISAKLSDKGDGLMQLTLKESAFFPEGGGQSCDLGKIAGLPVIDVQEKDGEVIHTVALKDGATDAVKTGDIAHCIIDSPRRFDNMQRHCGEHILSGIFYARCGGVNRGFHMGDSYMTIDISLEDKPSDPDASKPDCIDMDIALDCERRANEVIWSNAPVTVFRFDERNGAEDMPLRKALAFDEDISIVCVGSPDNPADCVACCGTHPSTAGQVGLIKILKVENYKGMFRIYFEAGARALEDYDQKHEILTALAESHSSSVEELPGAIRSQEEKLAAAKDELHHAKKALIKRESAVIDALLSPDGTDGTDASPLLLQRLEDLSLDDAFELAKLYMGKTSQLMLLYAAGQTSFILVSSGDPHCGNLVREYASFYNGKGGGSDTSARAIFTSEEDAMLFADLIEKHLR